ncbi:uncharacterized protein SCHCODRAFT_01355554 [Schizophyllum commune H4-8]|nr:uncharacterized protein SCHCODRAFT_01355554 [Schizophyllum commune H4-8]KAI5890038.1 hypothetical protein SCHCODRAFT_01355554 [Schizophyllum commune H4-8]
MLGKPAHARLSPSSMDDILKYKAFMLQVGLDLAFYGVQAALFIPVACVYARRRRKLGPPVLTVMLLFLMSTLSAVLAVVFRQTQFAIDSSSTTFQRQERVARTISLSVVFSVFYRVNYFASDIVVVHRAWVLWPNNRLAKGVLASYLSASLLGVIIDCILVIRYGRDSGLAPPAAETLAKTVPLLVTNLATTFLVGIRFWQYQHNIRRYLGPLTQRTKVEKVLVLFMESGFAYCLVWIAGLVIQVLNGGDVTVSTYGIVGQAYHCISGIYPTAVVLATITQREEMHSVLFSTHSLRFASNLSEEFHPEAPQVFDSDSLRDGFPPQHLVVT